MWAGVGVGEGGCEVVWVGVSACLGECLRLWVWAGVGVGVGEC